jgi:AraC-like DNA-binding protein
VNKNDHGGRPKVPSSRTLNFSDPFPYQKALRLADVELLPTKKGEFRGELTQITFDKVWMQHGTESLPNVVAGTVKQIRQSITFASNDRETVYRGVNVLPGGIIVHKADFEHRRSEENNSWGSMSLAHADFDAACKAVLGLEFRAEAPQHVVRPDPATMSRLLDLHKTVGQIAKTSPDILELPEVARALQQDLIHLMVRCLCGAEAAKISAGSLRHDLIIVKFEDFLKANPNTPLYLPEICAALGTAERTLRIACEEHLGMGPIRYLTLRRMHLVRRALLAADSSTTVTRVATDHGFWELGRFAVGYRELFGEPPSHSLRRAAVFH